MLLDTNIVIDVLAGKDPAASVISDRLKNNNALFVSTITVAEVLSLRTLKGADIAVIETFLDALIHVQPDTTISKEAGRLRREYGIELADALIVATALVRQMPLATRDKKLRTISELTVVDF